VYPAAERWGVLIGVRLDGCRRLSQPGQPGSVGPINGARWYGTGHPILRSADVIRELP
jgi:hypothetical protein